jgi:hypothetical protein
MKNFYHLVINFSLAFSVLMFASCASERTVTSGKVRTGLDQYNNGYEMEKGEHGMMQAGSDKISQFEGKKSNIGSRDFAGKNYNKESYRKERWGGNTKYDAQKYAGNTDGSRFQHSPYYVDRNARARDNGKYAAANGSQFATEDFAAASSRANEGNSDDVKTGASGYVTSRDNRPQPLIISKDDYNKLGIGDTKKMLGRE